MAQAGAIIMKYTLKGLTASQLWGQMLSICVSGSIYMVQDVRQIGDKTGTISESPGHGSDSK